MSIGLRIGGLLGPQLGPRIGTSAGGGIVVVKIGDSNDVGQMDVGTADSQFSVTTPSGPTFDKFYGTAANEPVTMHHFGPTQLTAYGVAPGAGAEITMGRTLQTDIGLQVYLMDVGISGTRTVDWLPTSTYGEASPDIGGKLFSVTVARVRSVMASTGYAHVVFSINLGTNDAVVEADALAMSANMTAINNALRAAFPGCVIVWNKTHVGTTNTFTSTVRTQQASYATTAPSWFALLDMDWGVLLGDGLHYDANTYLDLGVQTAFALADLLGIARRPVATTPALMGYGTAVVSATTVTARPWMGSQIGDKVYAFAQVAAIGTVSGTPADWTPSGWTLTKSGNTANSGVNVQFALFERALAAGDFTAGRPKAVAFVTPGTESSVKMFTWRCAATPTTHVAQETALNTFGQGPSTITGLTTTLDNCAIAYHGSGWSGSPLAVSVTITPPGTVASATEVHDAAYQQADTAAHVITLTTATKAARGVIAAATATNTPNMVQAFITLAIAP